MTLLAAKRSRHDTRPLRAAQLCLAAALAAAAYLATSGPAYAATGAVPLLALAVHALPPLPALLLISRRLPGRVQAVVLVPAALALALGAAIWLPGLPTGVRSVLRTGHVLTGIAAVALLLIAGAVAGGRRAGPAAALGLAAFCLLLLPAGAYVAAEHARADWKPPEYRPDACYRFLTATTAAQSGEPAFPSALRLRASGGAGCTNGGCHRGMPDSRVAEAHAGSASSPAYAATYQDFVQHRGAEAGRWCRGCHEPGQVVSPHAAAGGGVTCAGCHGATDVHALYGSGALDITAPSTPGLDPLLRPTAHASRYLRPELHQSAEFCGGCHRKNWSLPQNQYRWMPGPDEYREWQTSRFSGASLFAPGEPVDRRSCVGCHDPHGSGGRRDTALEIDLFFRQAGPDRESVAPLEQSTPLRTGERSFLDVVVANTGIGHDFPFGMPDLNEAWLEVRALDRAGRLLGSSGLERPDGSLQGAPHRYHLTGLKRGGQPVAHGDLDQMVAVGEWRRIPAGRADLARYRLPGGAAAPVSISVRLLRRRRPEFSRWAGEPPGRTEELASVRSTIGRPEGRTAPDDEGRWRHYGTALAAVRSYPHAIQALQRALTAGGNGLEARLALGQVYLEEGDLLAAQEQFARVGGPRGRAWEGAVLRQMGQPERAVALLEPLAGRFPRDLRLRFELGQAYMAQLRHDRAAREFTAMLDVDPVDVSAHYNLMLSLQRLNQLTDARREEAIYRLLAEDDAPPVRSSSSLIEGRPLHVHTLEAP